jgi:hypothetical protein
MKNIFILFLLLIIFSGLIADNSKINDFGNWKRYSASIANMIDDKIYDPTQIFEILGKGKLTPPKAIKNCTVKINSFNFLLLPSSGGNFYHELANGDTLTNTMKIKLRTFKSGDYLIFENIIGECKETKQIVKLPPIILH